MSNVCFALLLPLSLQFYIAFSFLCRDKADCNEIHPYISFVPVWMASLPRYIWYTSTTPLTCLNWHLQIISFILLRNISNLLRSRFSLLFAWFGKISLEVSGVLFLILSHTVVAALCCDHQRGNIWKCQNKWTLTSSYTHLYDSYSSASTTFGLPLTLTEF